MAPFHSKSIVEQIRTSKRHVTVLFTDIVDSVQYFEKKGDVFGRLMVDQSNSIIFPIIKKFSGRVIKTIGDGVMASFKEPYNAINASIAIQQTLELERNTNEDFDIHVKIGVHTGITLVESKDLYGDVVNVTARIQKTCLKDEIRFTEGVMEFLIDDPDKLERIDDVELKGKAKPLPLYVCNWEQYPYLLEGFSIDGSFPVVTKQKFEILTYAAFAAGILYFLYLTYFRYLVVDSESFAQYALNPLKALLDYPSAVAFVGVLFVALLTLLYRLQRVPYVFFQLLKGGFGFAIGMLFFYVPMSMATIKIENKWNEEIYASKNFFVEVMRDSTNVHTRASDKTPVLQVVNKGDIFLFKEQRYRQAIRWNKIFISQGVYGWVPRNTKVLEEEVALIISKTNKFVFRYKDFYAFMAGLVGFIWGFYNFRVRLS